MYARIKNKQLYAVRGDTLDGKNQWLSTAIPLNEAKHFKSNIKSDMRIAIPKYHWVRNVKIIKNIEIVKR